MKNYFNYFLYLAGAAFIICLSGCTGVANRANQVYPVIENADDGLTTVYAGEEDTLLGEFTTKFDPVVPGRGENIKIAAEKINNTVILPQEVFSYNDTTGPTSKNEGYKLAKIFVKGKEKKGYGGGVCQVSSTLYNAVLMAELEVVERHPHTKEVHYVEPDKDAAVSYGAIDLKFTNTYNVPIRITTSVGDDFITTQIYSYTL